MVLTFVNMNQCYRARRECRALSDRNQIYAVDPELVFNNVAEFA